ncbi:MAG TPA: hypothetical protein DIW05_06765 [Syntrophaceae bacterium]|nr:hypothetical protein [Syntrophaceae bacterium]
MINLDRIAAEASQSILNCIGTSAKRNTLQAKDLERLTANALGILQEQGLYAFFLYLLSRSGDEAEGKKLEADEVASCVIMARLLSLLNQPELKHLSAAFANGWDQEPAQINKDKKKILQHVSGQIGGDLRRLLMVKTLFEKALIYTRYGAKAITSSVAEGSS